MKWIIRGFSGLIDLRHFIQKMLLMYTIPPLHIFRTSLRGFSVVDS